MVKSHITQTANVSQQILINKLNQIRIQYNREVAYFHLLYYHIYCKLHCLARFVCFYIFELFPTCRRSNACSTFSLTGRAIA